MLFLRRKIRVDLIDIFAFLLNQLKEFNQATYNSLIHQITKKKPVYFLLCDYEAFSDDDRYKYFLAIFKKYQKEKKYIYYFRFQQVYGPLKNIDNMARKMQLLLPESKRNTFLAILKKEMQIKP